MFCPDGFERAMADGSLEPDMFSVSQFLQKSSVGRVPRTG